MPPSPPHRRLDLAVALSAGILAAALYLLTLAHTQSPDAVNYAQLDQIGVRLHPQHLLHHLVGWGFASVGGLVAPGVPLLTWLSALNALGGGLGVGAATWLLRRAGVGLPLCLAGAALLATSYGWWSLSTTAEVHALPVAVQLVAVAGLLGRRSLGAGLAHGGALLLHKTMVLASPAMWLAERWTGRRGLSAPVLGLAVAGLAYGVVMAHELATTPDPLVGVATAWLLGEVAHGVVGPPGHETVLDAALGGAATAWVFSSGPRCGFGQGVPGFPMLTEAARAVAWRWIGAGAGAGAVLGLAGVVRLSRRHPGLLVVLLGWPVLAVGAVLWFEPGNYEYYLGPVTCALLLAVAGAQGLADLLPWRRLASVGLAVALAVVALAVGRHNLAVDIGPARDPSGEHRTCGAGPPRGPPPQGGPRHPHPDEVIGPAPRHQPPARRPRPGGRE